MSAGDIYIKTQSGLDEIQTRKLNLPHRLRCMLIVVDGVQPEFLLLEDAQKLKAPQDSLQQLLTLGLIVKVNKNDLGQVKDAAKSAEAKDEYTRFRNAKNFMNVTLVEALGVGVKSFLFTLKLEKAGTCADLIALLPTYEAALTKSMGDVESEVLVKRLRKLLAN